MARILVLAGVNGAGKSSLLGTMLEQEGATWFNPDTFAKARMQAGVPLDLANAEAWEEGQRRLEDAIAGGGDYAFETTLGGTTITRMLLAACRKHAVHVWYCGLESVDLHIARVAARVAAGGHDIPESKIRERYDASRQNLITLLPHLASLHVYDNSCGPDAQMRVGLVRVLEMDRGTVRFPASADEHERIPLWARPIVQAAVEARTARR